MFDIGCGKLWDNNPINEDILFSCFDNPKYKITGIDIFPQCIEWRKKRAEKGLLFNGCTEPSKFTE